MYPIPDATYLMTFSYLYLLPTLVADADTNAWMNDGEELIRQGAKRRLWLDILYNPQNAQICQGLEDDAADTLFAETRTRLPNQTLRTDLPVQGTGFNIYVGR